MLNSLTQKNLEQHVTVLGWLHIGSNILLLIIGGFVFFLLTTIGVISGDQEATAILGMVGTFIGLLMAALAIPGMIAGWGLLKRKNWGRVLGIVVGVFSLMNFPLGTAIGVYTLYVLLQEEGPRLLCRCRHSPGEIRLLASFGSNGGLPTRPTEWGAV
ncbi:MAG: hypothetical protein Fur0021_04510 [Candidatus Promineifilaceae bacterium]